VTWNLVPTYATPKSKQPLAGIGVVSSGTDGPRGSFVVPAAPAGSVGGVKVIGCPAALNPGSGDPSALNASCPFELYCPSAKADCPAERTKAVAVRVAITPGLILIGKV
jgi:hypothetical protein